MSGIESIEDLTRDLAMIGARVAYFRTSHRTPAVPRLAFVRGLGQRPGHYDLIVFANYRLDERVSGVPTIQSIADVFLLPPARSMDVPSMYRAQPVGARDWAVPIDYAVMAEQVAGAFPADPDSVLDVPAMSPSSQADAPTKPAKKTAKKTGKTPKKPKDPDPIPPPIPATAPATDPSELLADLDLDPEAISRKRLTNRVADIFEALPGGGAKRRVGSIVWGRSGAPKLLGVLPQLESTIFDLTVAIGTGATRLELRTVGEKGRIDVLVARADDLGPGGSELARVLAVAHDIGEALVKWLLGFTDTGPEMEQLVAFLDRYSISA